MHAVLEMMLGTQGRVCVACHRNPDGDTLGAGLALYLWLRDQGKDVGVYCVDPAPPLYAFLPGAADITADAAPCALLVMVDIASPELLGPQGQQLMAGARAIVNIDHHRTNSRYGDAQHVVDTASSTAELVTALLLDGGFDITSDIADCLYTGIVTDTGRFGFDYTTPDALRMAAVLMERGARFESIQYRVFRQRSLARTGLLGTALGSLRMLCGGRLAVLSLSLADLACHGAIAADAESIVNYAVEIEGVELGALLRETADGAIKVSLRSAGAADASALAQRFGGGGHRKAAGCTVEGPMDAALLKIRDAAEGALGCL